LLFKFKGYDFFEKLRNILSTFNRIDKLIKEKLNKNDDKGFIEDLEEIVKVNPIFKRYKKQLKKFAKLRNVIVHDTTSPSYVIAEPHDSVVEEIQHIENELRNPKKVYPMFGKEVVTFQITDKLVNVLRVIKEMDYTQFPLYDGEKFMGLLSENGITKWLAKNVEDGIFDGDTLLSDVISFEEEENNFSFINREASIYEAKEAFRNYIDKGLELDALLITNSGSAHEKLMGIITRWDIITIQ